MKTSLFSSRKVLSGIIIALIALLAGWAGVFGYYQYQNYKEQKQLDMLGTLLDTWTTDMSSCEKMYRVPEKLVYDETKFFRRSEYDDFKEQCDINFDISRQEQSLEFCEKVIVGNKRSFKKDYIRVDSFSDVQRQCSLKYLTVTFSIGSLFDVENDFKSSVNIDFGLPFYEDISDIESEEFLENRIRAKKRLIELLDISPKLELSEKNIVLYPRSAILVLDLQPETKYSFSLKEYDSAIEWEKVETKKFELLTPENKYFWLRKKEKIALFRDTTPPEFELVSYDSGKIGAKVKLCRIENESYAKIEAFMEEKWLGKQRKEFFKTGIDTLPNYECFTKQIDLEGDDIIQRSSFNFNEEIGLPSRSGLYFLTFEDEKEREFSKKVQEPIFFGIIDSHITMKISRNGEAFFFVNDFSGKPLSWQHIRVYANEFISKDSQWNSEKQDYVDSYYSPLENNIFGKAISLWKTDKNGVLKVNMKDAVDDVFWKTFQSWNYDWDGNYDSFFITSASDANLSYVSSKWNGWISPWNFGYTTGNYWWYGESENMDEISLDRWGDIGPEMYSHMYSDRKLYLPGEEVYIKAVVRNSKDLSIPVGKKLRLEVRDAKGDEILSRELTLSEYGSISEKIMLPNTAPLGNYSLFLYNGDEQIGYGGFSVEIFKNPKFKNEIMLKTQGLNGELVQITDTKTQTTDWGWKRENYLGNFSIQADISSQYYSGSPVKNVDLEYKVYKQDYYDQSYWDECYYGCYWEPEKEFYTEGTARLDENGHASIEIPVEFSSDYSDYKYIVEVSVTDKAGDSISGSNAIIARLPKEFKKWDSRSGISFKTEKRFYKQWEKFIITWWLNNGSFNKEYNNKYLLLIKKKNYITEYVDDVRGYTRPIMRSEEVVEKILKVNDTNFKLNPQWKLELQYALKESGEYIFEFGKINSKLLFNTQKLIQEFQDTGAKKLVKNFSWKLTVNWDTLDALTLNCDSSSTDCSENVILKKLWCKEDYYIDETCEDKKVQIHIPQVIRVDDLIDPDSRKYFTLISYWDELATNPIQSDNKITVLSEKISYKLWETARILVRLPFSNGKILLTTEKQGVLDYEYINVPGNIFFKEIQVDSSFMPNAYIGVVAIDTGDKNTPEYKVGYTEIVVDKSEKKTDIAIKSNKKTYEPREQVTLNIAVKDRNKKWKKSELTVMVVDDALISLMGNIDVNTLEKFYKKLPFQIQTSITNLAMLQNYYFSRRGIVGGSGFGNFKWGDSAVSSRNIFKNTAYYNPSVITDANGNARVSFSLPDNLTNFRVMVLSNSKDNFFGYAESMIEVRKDVIVEDRTPLIIRYGDEIILGANVFNTTDKEIGFTATLKSTSLEIEKQEQLSMIAPGESEFISWRVTAKPEIYAGWEKINYSISILGDSVKHSDKIEWKIQVSSSPVLMQKVLQSKNIASWQSADLTLDLPENTNIELSQYSISLSNNPLQGIQKILASLAKYPYGCIEQTLSSTMPNAVLSKFSSLLWDVGVSQDIITKNLEAGIERIGSMQVESGWFGYWQWDSNADLAVTPYVLRSLLEIKASGGDVKSEMIEEAVTYLEKNYSWAEENTQIEILWALAKYNAGNYIGEKLTPLGLQNLTDSFDATTMDRHNLIAYTYALVLANPVKYKYVIDANIEKIKTKLSDTQNYNYSVHYYDALDDTAIFTQMLIDYNYDNSYVFGLILKLYRTDWSSYYYSTKTKNDAFFAFAKYIEIYGKQNNTEFLVSLNGKSQTVHLGGGKNKYTTTVPLSSVLENGRVSLQVKNISGSALFMQASIQGYPQDVLKVPAYSNGVSISREIYEVLDSSLLDTCERQSKRYDARYSDETQLSDCKWVYKKYSGENFKKWATYKIKLTAKFLDDARRKENVTFEDYLPASFRILNNNFNTNSIATSQNTTKDAWRWTHTEKRPELLMTHAKYVYGNSATYEYFITPDFAGTFTYPPATVYMMYQPDTRANTVFRRIDVK